MILIICRLCCVSILGVSYLLEKNSGPGGRDITPEIKIGHARTRTISCAQDKLTCTSYSRLMIRLVDL